MTKLRTFILGKTIIHCQTISISRLLWRLICRSIVLLLSASASAIGLKEEDGASSSLALYQVLFCIVLIMIIHRWEQRRIIIAFVDHNFKKIVHGICSVEIERGPDGEDAEIGLPRPVRDTDAPEDASNPQVQLNSARRL